jgi:polar amino acid transport system permease protein
MFEFAQASQFFTSFGLSDLSFLAEAAGRTLLISVVSISIGTVLGCIFGWLLSVSRWAGAATLGLFLDAFRSIPLIIQPPPAPSCWSFTPAPWWRRSPAVASRRSRSPPGARAARSA